jgi:hypothetical protein
MVETIDKIRAHDREADMCILSYRIQPYVGSALQNTLTKFRVNFSLSSKPSLRLDFS